MHDPINGAFELVGAGLILLHCRQLVRDGQSKGVALAPFVFFTAWGYWNLYYYPAVGCWWSFAGGLCVVATNTLYVGMLLWYRRAA